MTKSHRSSSRKLDFLKRAKRAIENVAVRDPGANARSWAPDSNKIGIRFAHCYFVTSGVTRERGNALFFNLLPLWSLEGPTGAVAIQVSLLANAIFPRYLSIQRAILHLILLLLLIITPAAASQPQPWQMGLQEAATPVMENITFVHNILLGVIFAIGLLVLALVTYAVYRFRESRHPTPSQRSHHTLLEIVWTLVPALILIMVGIPSIRILYKNDKVHEPEITIKATGHQWYWSYEIKHGDKQVSFDSYMIETQDLKPGQLRNLEVDNRIIVPKDATVQLLTTSADVLHSFTIPSFGIKKDSVPGRINETWFRVAKTGVYYGQCSELCGIRHGFMPIVVEVVSRETYDQWLNNKATPADKKA